MVRSLERVADFSATLTGYLAAAGTIHFSTWSGPLLQEPGGQLLSGIRRHRPGGVRNLPRDGCPRRRERRCHRNFTHADAPPRRDARRDRRHRVRAVARHAHAGLRLALSRLSTDAGPARRGALRQPLPARDGGAGCVRAWRRCVAGCTRPARHSRSASRSSRWRTSSRCARRSHYTRFDGIPASTRCSPRSPVASSSPKCPSIRRRASFENAPLRAHLDRALAAADERLQRLHARRLPRVRGLVLVLSAGRTRSRRCGRRASPMSWSTLIASALRSRSPRCGRTSPRARTSSASHRRRMGRRYTG